MPAVLGTDGEALPVPCESDDGDVQLGTGSPRPPGASTEAEDGRLSFSLVGMEPVSPAGPDAVQGTDGLGPSSPTNGAPSISDKLSLLSLAEGAGGALGQDEGITPRGQSTGAVRRTMGRPWPVSRPPGVVSPPAVTAFGGGIGATDGANGADSDANVAHSVEVSESES